MLNSHSEETLVLEESSMTSDPKQGSTISKLNRKYLSFHLKDRKDIPLKNEENSESVERVKSGEGKSELSSGKSPGFFKTLTKKLQIKKFMPSKSKQRIKVTEPSSEISRRNESMISVSLDRPNEIKEQIMVPKNKSSSDPVNSYIAAVMFNSKNEEKNERVPRFNELAASQFVLNSTEFRNYEVKHAILNSQEKETSSTDSELSEKHQGINLLKQEAENNNEEYQYDDLIGETETRAISPVYPNWDAPEGKSETKVTLIEELLKLSKYGWYWGPISGEEADAKLKCEPDGAFLVRDSSDDRYLLTLTFKSSGKVLHARMEHSGGLFSLCNPSENYGYTSLADLINHSMSCSKSAVVCYSRPRHAGHPAFPVRMTKPVSRFTQVRSLQYLCRFVIRQNTRLDNIHKLPLPKPIRGYIEEAHY